MHKIYFEDRCLLICSPDDQSLSDPNAVAFHPAFPGDAGMLAETFRTAAMPAKIYIVSDNPEETYRSVCSRFREVNAAGGLVQNRRADCLLIRRNGLWDLPKGHQEPGEDIRTTAFREVQEETGLTQIDTRELICVTDHCYLRAGIWHLKHTWWYDMLYTAPVDLTPQKEEDITKAAWVARSSLPPFLKNTYPSIVEVFREAHI